MDRIDCAYVERLRDLARECDSVGGHGRAKRLCPEQPYLGFGPEIEKAARDWELSHPGR